jgi:hypothetical protein
MEFRNLTPFDAMAFTGIDTKDREYHVVALCVGYQMQRQYLDATPSDPRSKVYAAHLMEQNTAKLCLADEHWGEPTRSSLKRETDLVPYKPKCDVTVVGSAYSKEAAQLFNARLALSMGGKPAIDKTLRLTGPREFKRAGGLGGWLREGVNPTRAYSLTPPKPTREVPLRYELAYGGACVVPNPKLKEGGNPHLINEVCYRNPVGAGWIAAGFFAALEQTPQGLPPSMRAPQITTPARHHTHLIQTRQSGPMDVRQMAQLDYQAPIAGFGPLCKAWAPRLVKAGTYDQKWLEQRHPNLPQDFDFGYWNGAPEDQQMDFADLSQGVHLHTEGLMPGGGTLSCQLPRHRALVLADLGGARLPLPMQIDTIEWSSDSKTLRTVWRTAILTSMAPDSLELRFETNPNAPWVKYKALESTA